MSDKRLILDNLRTCWASLDTLLGSLSDNEWERQSLCPDFTTHGVVVHLAAIEDVLSGWVPESAETPLPFEKAGEFTGRAGDWSGPEVLAALRPLMDTRFAELEALDQAVFDGPCMTPVGPATYGRFMEIREFDFWVHERDIRTPLGRPAADDGGPEAEMALAEIHRSLGYIVGKRIGLPDGMSICFRLTGPVTKDLFVAVDGRAGVVDHVADPDVVVTTDSLTFVQLACGRIDPGVQIETGAVSWSGDAEWGETAARNLRFTM